MKSFQSFRLDTENLCLLRGEERVAITPKAFDVLRHLVENAGRLVTPDELLQALWPETYVNPEVLRKYILEIRKALQDRPDRPTFIETVTKRGYRFIAAVTEEAASELPPVLDDKEANEAAIPANNFAEHPGNLAAGSSAAPGRRGPACATADRRRTHGGARGCAHRGGAGRGSAAGVPGGRRTLG